MRWKTFMLEDTGVKTQEGFTIYRRSDTGECYPFLNGGSVEIPIGAMWFCPWFLGDDGKIMGRSTGPQLWWDGPENKGPLACKTPGGTWIIDSRANNCTMPADDNHRCWIRHGTPPEVHVDKNGVTCAAGAGSIQAGSWHGYLRNGYLEE